MERPERNAGPRLVKLSALAFVAIGLGALSAPRSSSRGYGLPAGDATSLGYVRALGARDLALGLVLLSLPDEPRVLARSVASCTVVAAADLLIIAAKSGRKAWKSSLTHLLGAACLAWSTALLYAGR